MTLLPLAPHLPVLQRGCRTIGDHYYDAAVISSRAGGRTGEEGVIQGVKSGSIVIDMSTIDPVTTRAVSEQLSEKRVKMLDAPVVRGVRGATEGTLAIYVGGEPDVFERCRAVLSTMGRI